MATSTSSKGSSGYQVILIHTLHNNLKCPFCELAMRDAIQTCRGERACESCYIEAKGNRDICPIDHEPITDKERYKDRYAIREILKLECYCNNKRNGCDWMGTIERIEIHIFKCEFESISCIKCSGSYFRKDVGDHNSRLCQFRVTTCTYCFVVVDAQMLEAHELRCDKKPTSCPYFCGVSISFDKLYDHFSTCATLRNGTTCPFREVGCDYQPKSNMDLNEHLQTSSITHAALSVTTYKSVTADNKNIKQQLNNEATLCVEMSKECDEIVNKNKEIAGELEKLEEKLKEFQREHRDTEKDNKHRIETVEKDVNEVNRKCQDSGITNIQTKLYKITVKYNEMETKINPNSGIFSNNISDNDTIDGLERLDRLESSGAVFSANLSDFRVNLKRLVSTSYEGRMLWKIDNIQYRMNQAVSGKVTDMHSAPAFQKRGGHKFCTRLYLNGDGVGKGTHVSIFFVVMRSEYDALLQWPFLLPVTIRLINPSVKEKTITESFVPDRNSSSFQRPTRDMNIAAGCPMFIRKEGLKEFIVDDTIYIETSISSS